MIDTGHIERVPPDEQHLEPGKYFVMPNSVMTKIVATKILQIEIWTRKSHDS